MSAKSPESLANADIPPSGEGGIDGDVERCGYIRPSDEGQLRDQIISLLPRLRRFSYSLTREHDACDDLVQETCLRALSRSQLWQEGTRLDSWLFRIAQNLWLDRKRSQRTRGEAVELDEIEELSGVDGRNVTESRLTLAEVSRGLTQLRPDHQVVLGLVCVDGMSYREAADVLEVPIGTVMSRLSRARLELAHVLEKGVAPGRRPKSEDAGG